MVVFKSNLLLLTQHLNFSNASPTNKSKHFIIKDYKIAIERLYKIIFCYEYDRDEKQLIDFHIQLMVAIGGFISFIANC